MAGKVKRIIFILIFLLFFSFQAFAKDEFLTSFDITYRFDDNGVCGVTYKIGIENLTSDVYVSKYGITIGAKKLTEVVMSDSSGKLETKVVYYENSTLIEADVNDKIAGIGNVLKLKLDFKTSDLAKKNGQIWEVILPGLPDQSEISAYKLKVEVPNSFGKILYVAPRPASELFWTKAELGTENINILFGELQVFDFELDYYLKNKEEKKLKETIALIPDTAYQKVYLYTLIPKPVRIFRDNDGNWLADYILDPGQELKVTATGSAEVYWTRRDDFVEKISDLDKYKRAEKYWEVNNVEIKKLAKELKTVAEIYKYVLRTLTYDYKRATEKVERFGALGALKKADKAICMEYTDLFIALARAAGIPAREIDGYAYSQNPKLAKIEKHTDVLHTWPEYYDKERGFFRPIDPTWEDSSYTDYFNKFDLNHLAFVIRGEESTYPYPAGSYKEQRMKKTVKVEFGKKRKTHDKAEQITVVYMGTKKLVSGLKQEKKLKIENLGPEAIYDLEITLRGNDFLIGRQKKYDKSYKLKVGDLLPYEKKELIIGFYEKNVFSGKKTNLAVSYLGKTKKISLEFTPFYVKFGWYLLIPGGILSAIFIFSFAKKSGRIPFLR